MHMLPGELRRTLGQRVLKERQPVLETTRSCRRIKDEETHFVPKIALVLTADNANGALEFLSVYPELTIQGH